MSLKASSPHSRGQAFYEERLKFFRKWPVLIPTWIWKAVLFLPEIQGAPSEDKANQGGWRGLLSRHFTRRRPAVCVH